MSQHIDPMPKQTVVDELNDQVANYGDTSGNVKSKSSVDLNTVTVNGIYYCMGCTNIPTGAANGFLQVINYGSARRQLYMPYSSDKTYVRTTANGTTWTNWTSLNDNGMIKCGSKTITIPAWSTGNPQSVEVDFTDDIPSGRSFYYVVATINSTLLPYINNSGVVKTWIRNTTGSNKKITIYSTDGDGWSNATLYYSLILK